MNKPNEGTSPAAADKAKAPTQGDSQKTPGPRIVAGLWCAVSLRGPRIVAGLWCAASLGGPIIFLRHTPGAASIILAIAAFFAASMLVVSYPKTDAGTAARRHQLETMRQIVTGHLAFIVTVITLVVAFRDPALPADEPSSDPVLSLYVASCLAGLTWPMLTAMIGRNGPPHP